MTELHKREQHARKLAAQNEARSKLIHQDRDAGKAAINARKEAAHQAELDAKHGASEG